MITHTLLVAGSLPINCPYHTHVFSPPPPSLSLSGIRSLQCILLKLCLLLGVKIHYGVEFLEILEPNEEIGWHASVFPEDHPISLFEFDFIVGKLCHIWSHIGFSISTRHVCTHYNNYGGSTIDDTTPQFWFTLNLCLCAHMHIYNTCIYMNSCITQIYCKSALISEIILLLHV